MLNYYCGSFPVCFTHKQISGFTNFRSAYLNAFGRIFQVKNYVNSDMQISHYDKHTIEILGVLKVRHGSIYSYNRHKQSVT